MDNVQDKLVEPLERNGGTKEILYVRVMFVSKGRCDPYSGLLPALILAGPFLSATSTSTLPNMFKSLKTTLTFVTLLLFVLALSAQVEAKGHAKVARHANRIIRKRAPQTGQTGGGGGGTNGGAAVESSGSIAQSESTSTSTTVSVASSTSSTSSTASTTTTRGGLLSTLLSVRYSTLKTTSGTNFRGFF